MWLSKLSLISLLVANARGSDTNSFYCVINITYPDNDMAPLIETDSLSTMSYSTFTTANEYPSSIRSFAKRKWLKKRGRKVLELASLKSHYNRFFKNINEWNLKYWQKSILAGTLAFFILPFSASLLGAFAFGITANYINADPFKAARSGLKMSPLLLLMNHELEDYKNYFSIKLLCDIIC
ncbi:hypothetical protein O9G_000541 [Rozella allomycis CSF55]|uniref:Uncharacterized protein n=1 Tax=Rozella allomycis (strain CSF55) TaxID=988480 RepID=A0A075B070_ROZAC|nr:hypothetical protein O9G_000541 [Rozella allomycis CSF55]|eukprot:EPZ34354.1 hypothetical protein O9G_000541 [Rozella allomycis CSF55]